MNITVVYNPKSGSSLTKGELEKLFTSHTITVDRYIDVTKNLSSQLRPLVKKPTIIAAIGGDGTLSSVANILRGTKAVFAPLPGGTLNHFTKDLSIDQTIEKAVANLNRQRTKHVDVATINDTVFVNNSSLGIYPSSLQAREKVEGTLGKWPAAVTGSIKALFRYKLYTVTIDGESFRTPFIFIGNNNYHLDEPDNFGRKRVDEGVLSIYTLKTERRLEAAWHLLLTLAGRYNDADKIEAWVQDSVTIHTKRNQVSISRDGELEKTSSPLVYAIDPKSLTVLY